MNSPRRVTHIAITYDPDAERVHRMALCSDGTMWTWEHDGSYGGRWHWVQMPDIPEQQAPQTADVWR